MRAKVRSEVGRGEVRGEGVWHQSDPCIQLHKRGVSQLTLAHCNPPLNEPMQPPSCVPLLLYLHTSIPLAAASAAFIRSSLN